MSCWKAEVKQKPRAPAPLPPSVCPAFQAGVPTKGACRGGAQPWRLDSTLDSGGWGHVQDTGRTFKVPESKKAQTGLGAPGQGTRHGPRGVDKAGTAREEARTWLCGGPFPVTQSPAGDIAMTRGAPGLRPQPLCLFSGCSHPLIFAQWLLGAAFTVPLALKGLLHPAMSSWLISSPPPSVSRRAPANSARPFCLPASFPCCIPRLPQGFALH